MKMTKTQFFKWAHQQTQYTENESLSPHNRNIADAEIVDVLPWTRFANIMCQLLDGNIEIIDEEESEY